MQTWQKMFFLVFHFSMIHVLSSGKKFSFLANLHFSELSTSQGKTLIFQTEDFFIVLILQKNLEKNPHGLET